ncbi:hypothetical protein AC579_5012 [Pseudocercospora musae]|uniref:FAD-binding domain-containing protein n=1 Tax=Pseudocercospora musae TaxID=113226 RepID=A0A139I8G2_9PEZI|nr:hypothetical protein AC579_5012 [Pseudocercospora musae]
MMQVFNAKERDRGEWSELAERAGLRIVQITSPAGSAMSLIELALVDDHLPHYSLARFPSTAQRNRSEIPLTDDENLQVGDAIHVMSPCGGVGANTALVDAAELAEVLVRTHGSPEVANVANFEERMRARAFKSIMRSYAGSKKMFDAQPFEDCPSATLQTIGKGSLTGVGLARLDYKVQHMHSRSQCWLSSLATKLYPRDKVHWANYSSPPARLSVQSTTPETRAGHLLSRLLGTDSREIGLLQLGNECQVTFGYFKSNMQFYSKL